MAYRPFYGKSEAWLLEQIDKAQNELAAGKTLTSVTAGGESASKLVETSIRERIRVMGAELYALDSTTYAHWASITTTKMVFS